jgi:hypothetical protein
MGVTKNLDTLDKLVYPVKYDAELKKRISIKDQY